MDTTLHSFLIAQHVQDRIADATATRRPPYSVRRRIHKPEFMSLAKM
jgi:hypothetical protein